MCIVTLKFFQQSICFHCNSLIAVCLGDSDPRRMSTSKRYIEKASPLYIISPKKVTWFSLATSKARNWSIYIVQRVVARDKWVRNGCWVANKQGLPWLSKKDGSPIYPPPHPRAPGGGHGNPFQCSCLENPHGQRSLQGCSPWGHKESDTTEQLSTARHPLDHMLALEVTFNSSCPTSSGYDKTEAQGEKDLSKVTQLVSN